MAKRKKPQFGEIRLPKGKTANERAKDKAQEVLPCQLGQSIFASGESLAILDEALTQAEIELRELLDIFSPEEISDAFFTHIKIHLVTELENIKQHGHRGDDPYFNPDEN